MKKPKNFPEFTHFSCIPFIQSHQRAQIGQVQDLIEKRFKEAELRDHLRRANTNLMHITLSMLTLNLEANRKATCEVMSRLEPELKELLKNTTLTMSSLNYFSRISRQTQLPEVTLVYIDFVEDSEFLKVQKAAHLIIKEFVQSEIISANEFKSMHITYDHNSGMFKNDQYHMTLFRIEGKLPKDEKFEQVFQWVREEVKSTQQLNQPMHCDCVDISTRGTYDGMNFYKPMARVVVGNQPQAKVIA